MDNTFQVQRLRTHWNIALFSSYAEEFRHSSALSDYHANESFDWLMKRYQSSDRKYHNLNHLEFLFNTAIPGVQQDRGWIIRTLFFFFHDCVYDINPANPVSDNEHRSAIESSIRMGQMGFEKDTTIIDEVSEIIELSNHTVKAKKPLHKFLLDCDLSILATEPDEYKEYVDAVRNEYGMVPQPVWVEKRTAFVKYMLGKDEIFQSPLFLAYGEEKARKNLSKELISLTFMS